MDPVGEARCTQCPPWVTRGTDRREIDRIAITAGELGKFPDDDFDRYVLDSPEKSIRGELAATATTQPTWVSTWDSG